MYLFRETIVTKVSCVGETVEFVFNSQTNYLASQLSLR